MSMQQWTEQTPSISDVLACDRAHQLDIWWAHYGEGKTDEQLLEVRPVCNHLDSAIRQVMFRSSDSTYSITPGLVVISSADGDEHRVEFNVQSPESLAMAVVKAGILAHLPARSNSLDNGNSGSSESAGSNGGNG